ncbi:MAG: prolyl oligopeptidase family serine peptidase [Planctomycetaceae bacterium]
MNATRSRASRAALVALLIVVAASTADENRVQSQKRRVPTQRVFRRDKNGDGKVSQAELPQAAWARLKHLDKDNDGQLTKQELQSSAGRQKKSPPKKFKPPFETRKFQGSHGETVDYGLFVPKSATPEKKLPLVLCLHGIGGSTEASKALTAKERRDKYPCIVMVPRCNVKEARWAINPLRGKGDHRSMTPELMETLDSVIREHPVDSNRVYITGQSMGGMGTWGLLAQHSNRFAAAIPVCGGWSPKAAKHMTKIPIWAFHGENDRAVPVDGSRNMIAALKKEGGSPRYTEYEGAGHGIWQRTYQNNEIWDWLFSQTRPDKSR